MVTATLGGSSGDPRLDARGATVSGPVNVAGDGVLTTSQAAAMAGRPVLGLPERLAPAASRWLTRLGAAELSYEDLRMLGYGRVLDTTRCREEMGFVPSRTTREAFGEFVEAHRLRGLRPVVDLVAEEIGKAVVETVGTRR